MTSIPTPETVDSAWLTEQLNRNGIKGTVERFEQKRVGTGQIGMCFRYQLPMPATNPVMHRSA